MRLYRRIKEYWLVCWRVPDVIALADPHHANAMQMWRPLANDLKPWPFPRLLSQCPVTSDRSLPPVPEVKTPRRDGVCRKSLERPMLVVMDMIWGTRKSLSCYITRYWNEKSAVPPRPCLLISLFTGNQNSSRCFEHMLLTWQGYNAT